MRVETPNSELSDAHVELPEMNNDTEETNDEYQIVSIEKVNTSIYHLYRASDRKILLFTCACISILMPFTDTVYLPALNSVAEDFNASDTSVALTVSIYLGCVGVGQLFWGPLSDRYGRTMVLYIVFALYLALTIGCIFADSINTLIIIRSFQGLVIGYSVVASQAIIADIFPPEELGEAMSAFLVKSLNVPPLKLISNHLMDRLRCWLVL